MIYKNVVLVNTVRVCQYVIIWDYSESHDDEHCEDKNCTLLQC